MSARWLTVQGSTARPSACASLHQAAASTIVEAGDHDHRPLLAAGRGLHELRRASRSPSDLQAQRSSGCPCSVRAAREVGARHQRRRLADQRQRAPVEAPAPSRAAAMPALSISASSARTICSGDAVVFGAARVELGLDVEADRRSRRSSVDPREQRGERRNALAVAAATAWGRACRSLLPGLIRPTS